MLHLLVGGLGFVAFAVAAFLLARQLARTSRTWAVLSVVAGILLLVGFAAIAAGGGNIVANVAFTVVVILAWAWFSWVSVIFYREAALEGRIEVPVAAAPTTTR
jgi:succinate-acetate transporter protein